MGALALAMSANADKIVFLSADALSAWAETPAEIADATETIIMPEGFFFVSPADRAPKTTITKPLACDYFSFAPVKDRIDAEGKVVDGKINDSYVTSGGLRWYQSCMFTVTPAKGVTVKNITVRSQSKDYTKGITLIQGENKVASTINTNDETNTFQTLAVNSAEAFNLHGTAGQNRVFYIIFETEGKPAGVMQPTLSTKSNVISANEEITLTAPTEGSEIYYTLDGSVPTTASTKYTAPVKLTENGPLRAIAAKGEETSFEIYEDFMVIDSEGAEMATFDFSGFTTLCKKADDKNLTLEELPIAKKNANIAITADNAFVNNGVTAAVSGGKIFRSWTFGNVVELRPDNGATITLTAPENKYISNVYIQGSKIAGQKYEGEAGELVPCQYNSSRAMWTAASGQTPTSVVIKSSIKDEYVNQVYVYYKEVKQGSGVAETLVEEDAPVEYYNLQGVRVANPENGLFIVKQGNKVSKKIFK